MCSLVEIVWVEEKTTEDLDSEFLSPTHPIQRESESEMKDQNESGK